MRWVWKRGSGDIVTSSDERTVPIGTICGAWYYSVPMASRDQSDDTARGRILEAAFAAFMQKGYAATSTLEIATRARVSKRELYTLVGNKQAMLLACIAERTQRLPLSAELPAASDRETLARVLAT